MATLQSSNQQSAFIAKSRLKVVTRNPPAPLSAGTHPEDETLPNHPPVTPVSASSTTTPSSSNRGLSEMEHRQLILQAAGVYPGWQLVSLQHRLENNVLVAHLVRSDDGTDPMLAMREGRSMQIIMDSTGDLRIRHARVQTGGLISRLLRWLFVGSNRSTRSSTAI